MIIIKKLKIKINFTLIIPFVLCLFNGQLLIFFEIITILLLHELGHLLMLQIFKKSPNSISFSIIGGIIDVDLSNLALYKRLLIYLRRMYN